MGQPNYPFKEWSTTPKVRLEWANHPHRVADEPLTLTPLSKG